MAFEEATGGIWPAGKLYIVKVRERHLFILTEVASL